MRFLICRGCRGWLGRGLKRSEEVKGGEQRPEAGGAGKVVDV